MRIDPSNGGNIGGAQNAGQSQSVNGGHAGQSSQAALERDQVDLSGASSLIALSAGTLSATRQAKISTLTAQVQNGTYSVDSAQVAHAIVNGMLRA